MLRVLIAKDLCRAGRNPLPWLINLIVPLALTALIGLVFGGSSESGKLGKIRFAVVNEDNARLSDVLRGVASQGDASQYLDPVFMARPDALREINAGNLSAVLIIPTNFVVDYFTAAKPVSLELIKNPAESIHPAVLEELFGTVVTALNVVSRNFNSEFPAWREVFTGHRNFDEVSDLVQQTGDKLKSVRKFINPPLVGYEKEEPPAKTNSAATTVSGNDSTSSVSSAAAAKTSNDNTFAYMLIGLSAMFLVFIGANAMTDLLRELRLRTFQRYQTVRQSLWPFIVGKVVFVLVLLLICSAVMLGGGGWIFGFHWQHPLLLLPLMFGYACFVAALLAVLVALVPDERHANMFNNIAGMALGLVGGCAFPSHELPALLRDHLTPLLPSNWLVETLRNLECGSAHASWLAVTLKLLVVAAVLVGLATVLFRRRFATGQRA